MRIVAHKNLKEFWMRHPQSRAALRHWNDVVLAADWQMPTDALRQFSKAKVLNGERIRFEIEGGNFRLIAAFDFRRQVAYVKFVGTHGEYDRIDPFTVSQF